MHELPAWLKKSLDALGLNSSRVQWKYHYFLEGLKENRDPLGGRAHWLTRRQKACVRCGTMVSPDESRCPECGARIPSRVGYLLRRAFGFMGVEFGAGVTPAFLVLFIFFYLLTKYQEYQLSQDAVLSSGEHIWSFVLIKWGALYESLIRENGHWWRIITMGLLHGGIIHLLFNSYAFFQLGPLIEQELGPWRTLVLITATQISAGLASVFSSQEMAFSVGASGFLFGLIGFGVGYYWRQPDAMSQTLHKVFLQWGMYALVFGFLMPRIDQSAHIGGGVAGIVLGVVFQNLPSTYHSRAMRAVWRIAGVLCIVAWTGAVVMMLLAQKDIAF